MLSPDDQNSHNGCFIVIDPIWIWVFLVIVAFIVVLLFSIHN